MKKEEAIELIISRYPNHYVDKITETDKYFLISIVLEKALNTGSVKPVICDDGLKAVDKKTKEIFTYNPIIHGLRNIKPYK